MAEEIPQFGLPEKRILGACTGSAAETVPSSWDGDRLQAIRAIRLKVVQGAKSNLLTVTMQRKIN